MSDHWQAELDELVAGFCERVGKLAQDRTETHASLHAKTASNEWKRDARLETELTHEVEFLERAAEAIAARITGRQRLIDEQIAKRRTEFEKHDSGDEVP